MLAQKFRLSDKKAFVRVRKEGKVFQSDNFGIAYVDRGDTETSRFAFIVSTRIAKDAVDRNRFKRAMSEGVRSVCLDTACGYNVIFLAKTSIVRVPTSEVMKEVRLSLKKSGLLE